MTLHWALGLFFAFLGFVALGGFAQFWILVEMTEQVNKKKAPGETVDPFALTWRRTSWYSILHEYRRLYPTGALFRFEIIALSTMVLCWICAAYLLFEVLPRWAHPSR